MADTHVLGDQAVVIHIPANTSKQVAKITVEATLTNQGLAFSQSGSVAATGLQGNATLAISAPAAAGVQAGADVAMTTQAPSTDVRNTNYAIADSGDALAIGVKASTVVQGTQRITVIIDDNSSGNRIEIVFHVSVANQGRAEAISGAARAAGQIGNLQLILPASGTSGLQAALNNTASARSGSATAIGVDATTAIDILQWVDVRVGNNSSDNHVQASFDVDVSNQGWARAASGVTQATGQQGSTAAGPGTANGDLIMWSAENGSLALSNVARGKSGDAQSTGLHSNTQLSETQRYSGDLTGPLAMANTDRVLNLGLARSVTGEVNVIAQLIPAPELKKPETPQPSPSAEPSAQPQPSAAAEPAAPHGAAAPQAPTAAAIPESPSPSPEPALAIAGVEQQPTPTTIVVRRKPKADPAPNPGLRAIGSADDAGGPPAPAMSQRMPYLEWTSRSAAPLAKRVQPQQQTVSAGQDTSHDQPVSVAWLLGGLLPALAALLRYRHRPLPKPEEED